MFIFIISCNRTLYVQLIYAHNYSKHIFYMQNRAFEYTKSFQATLLVKAPSLCNLDSKVTECLEILVFCGYGGMGLN